MKLCECGCGDPAPIAKVTCKRDGYVKGQPKRLIRFHVLKIKERYRVDKDTGCWVWLLHLNNKGYGVENVEGTPSYAHINSYVKHKGRIPAGLELDHLCRRPACINPDHLEPVTHAENMRRAKPRAKLSQIEVEEIRKRYAAGQHTQRELGEMFAITQANVSEIVLRKSWV